MSYRLPIGYDGMGRDFGDAWGIKKALGPFSTRAFVKTDLITREQLEQPLTGQIGKMVKGSSVHSAPGSFRSAQSGVRTLDSQHREAYPWRAEHGKEYSPPSAGSVAAAQERLEMQQLATAQQLRDEGDITGAQQVLEGSALEQQEAAVAAQRAQEAAALQARDAQILASNQRNKMLGMGIFVLGAGAALWYGMKS